MSVNSHTAAAIAEIVLYAPMVPISLYLMIRNWKHRPRTAWYPPAAFSSSTWHFTTTTTAKTSSMTDVGRLVRLVGGIMTIIEQQNKDDRSLIIATIVLLNIGLIPLLMAFLGYARLV